jgi:hypothetical protein
MDAASDTLLTRISRIFTKQILKIRENSCHSCQKSIACSTKKIVSNNSSHYLQQFLIWKMLIRWENGRIRLPIILHLFLSCTEISELKFIKKRCKELRNHVALQALETGVGLGLRIAESIDNQPIPQSAIRNPKSAIPNPQSVVYIIDFSESIFSINVF